MTPWQLLVTQATTNPVVSAAQQADTKECSRCHQVLPLESFYTRPTGSAQSMCKSCSYERTKEWRAAKKCKGCGAKIKTGVVCSTACRAKVAGVERKKHKANGYGMRGAGCACHGGV